MKKILTVITMTLCLMSSQKLFALTNPPILPPTITPIDCPVSTCDVHTKYFCSVDGIPAQKLSCPEIRKAMAEMRSAAMCERMKMGALYKSYCEDDFWQKINQRIQELKIKGELCDSSGY